MTVLTAIVTVVLSFSLYNIAGDHGWMKECYCGLSPALFALKPVSLALGGPERTSFFVRKTPSRTGPPPDPDCMPGRRIAAGSS